MEPLHEGSAAFQGRPLREQPVGVAVGWGFLLAGLQIVFACVATGKPLAEAYPSLCQWDGLLYTHIAQHGYRSTVPPVPGDMDRANVAFFPGYPAAGRLVAALTGLSWRVAMVLAAQLAAWVFWTYLLLFFDRWHSPHRLRAMGVLAVLLHPAAFYLVVAYSESLFMAALLGFLYWWQARERPAGLAAGLHGLVMTATRLGGLPLAFYPLADGLIFGHPARRFRDGSCLRWTGRTLLPAVVASVGGLGFFAFCQWKFGCWNLYFETQRVGWHVVADYFALLDWKNYVFFACVFSDAVKWPDDLSRLSTLIGVAAFVALAFIEWRFSGPERSRGRRERMAFYVCAWGLFFFHAAGCSCVSMRSMVRYSFGSHVLLVLSAVQWLTAGGTADLPGKYFTRGKLLAVGALVALLLLLLQAALIWRFGHNVWVA